MDELKGVLEENIAPYEFFRNIALITLLKKLKTRRKQLDRLSKKLNNNYNINKKK